MSTPVPTRPFQKKSTPSTLINLPIVGLTFLLSSPSWSLLIHYFTTVSLAFPLRSPFPWNLKGGKNNFLVKLCISFLNAQFSFMWLLSPIISLPFLSNFLPLSCCKDYVLFFFFLFFSWSFFKNIAAHIFFLTLPLILYYLCMDAKQTAL